MSSYTLKTGVFNSSTPLLYWYFASPMLHRKCQYSSLGCTVKNAPVTRCEAVCQNGDPPFSLQVFSPVATSNKVNILSLKLKLITAFFSAFNPQCNHVFTRSFHPFVLLVKVASTRASSEAFIGINLYLC